MAVRFVLLSLLHVSLVQSSPNPQVTVTITEGPTIPSTAPQFTDTNLFTSVILNSTNFFREQHNASDVVYNETLADFATEYLANNTDCAFTHSEGPYGENIAIGCSDAQGCVDLWGDEGSEYDYHHPDFSESTGHFTQLVWKNTTAVGCGSKLCGTSGWYLVCEYWPRGNVIGEFAQMVNPGNGAMMAKPSIASAALGLVIAVAIGLAL